MEKFDKSGKNAEENAIREITLHTRLVRVRPNIPMFTEFLKATAAEQVIIAMIATNKSRTTWSSC
jgi:hypothetical protein